MIPLSLLATFIGLTVVGIPANLLSLGAMDFGIIVDGAVIVVENIFRQLGAAERRRTRADTALRLAAICEAAIEVGRPTFFSMLIIIAAHIPIFTLQRHEGRIFAPMAWTVTSALVGSLVLSLTLVPLLCLWLLAANVAHEDNRLVRMAEAPRTSRCCAGRSLRPRVVIGIAAGCARRAACCCRTQLGSEFLPELNEGTIWVNVTLPPSVSPQEAQSQMRDGARGAAHGARGAHGHLQGGPARTTAPIPRSSTCAELFVDFKPEAQWRPGNDKDDLIREMDAAVSAMPGMETSFSQPIRDNVLESISQVDGQIVIKVRGDDLDRMQRRGAPRCSRRSRSVPGVTRAFIDRDGPLPQYLVDIDRARAARYGLNVGDIQDVIETALAGKATTELWEGEKHFSVVVRLRESERDLANLPKLLVDDAGRRPGPAGAARALPARCRAP